MPDVYTPTVEIAEFIPAYPGHAGDHTLFFINSAPLCGVGEDEEGVLYIPGYSGHTSGPIGTVRRVVVHATVSGCFRGGAREVASYFQRATSGGLAHYIVDPGEIVQCAPENLATWGAPPNAGEIHVEMCDPQVGDPARWNDADHQAMVALTVALVKDICTRHGLPLVAVSPARMLAGYSGIVRHLDVSNTWHQTDHSDPESGGPFGWDAFIAAVNAHPTAPEEDMPLTQDEINRVADAVWQKQQPASFFGGATPLQVLQDARVDVGQSKGLLTQSLVNEASITAALSKATLPNNVTAEGVAKAILEQLAQS